MGTERATIRNIISEPWKVGYNDLRTCNKQTETMGMACSTEFIATPWDLASGSVLGIIKLKSIGRNPDVTKFLGHTGQIYDVNFSPFFQNVIATASDDSTVRVWSVCHDPPPGHEVRDALTVLSGHSRKVLFCNWNPCADFILSSASSDCDIRIWNLITKQTVCSLNVPTTPTYLDWNFEGSYIGVTCKDKYLRVFDPREKSCALAVVAHQGPKAVKFVWLEGNSGSPGHLLTCGFSERNERQMRLWDIKKMTESFFTLDVDKSSQPLYPVFDCSLGIVYVMGKGDATCRFYQYQYDKLSRVDEHNSKVSVKSFCFAPKRALDAMKCEIGRLMKNEAGRLIQPVSLIVPRKNVGTFHNDLFPPCPSNNDPALTADEWLNGKTAKPKLEPFFTDPKPLSAAREGILGAPAVLEKEVHNIATAASKMANDNKILRDEVASLKSRIIVAPEEVEADYESKMQLLEQKHREELNDLKTRIDFLQQENSILKANIIALQGERSGSLELESISKKYNEALKKLEPIEAELNDMRSFFIEVAETVKQ